MTTWEEISKINSPCGGVIVFNSDLTECVLVKEKSRDSVNIGFPKGKYEKNKKKENFLDCAKRELKEESGMEFSQLKFIDCYHINDYTHKGNLSVTYLAAVYDDNNPHIFTYDPNELIFSGFVPLDEAIKTLGGNRAKILHTVYELITTKNVLFMKGNELLDIMSKLKPEEKKDLSGISKTMTWILRHNALKLGLAIDSAGWVSVREMLSLEQMKGVSEDIIKQIVDENDKKRFELCTTTELMIRAVQGHSSELAKTINDDELLEEILEPIDVCVHGTTKKAWNIIKNDGLKVMDRIHIHFAKGIPGENIISGMRNDSKVLIYVDTKMAMDEGIKFYTSKNGVILSKGIDGIILPKYFKDVVIL